MASKEIMVSAPLLVLLWDRATHSRSFGEALRRHWKLHLSLAATWGVLAGCLVGADRGEARTSSARAGDAGGGGRMSASRPAFDNPSRAKRGGWLDFFDATCSGLLSPANPFLVADAGE